MKVRQLNKQKQARKWLLLVFTSAILKRAFDWFTELSTRENMASRNAGNVGRVKAKEKANKLVPFLSRDWK